MSVIATSSAAAYVRRAFVVVLAALGCQMIYHGVTGGFSRD